MTNEELLVQLGYTVNDAVLSQLEKVKDNTKNFEKIQKHIVDLNDALKVNSSHIALSNSQDYLKIKIEVECNDIIAEAKEKISHWSDKYKVELEKVQGKDTYYILGFDK